MHPTYFAAFRIHVRRTDKVGTEAAFHGIEEYMEPVKEYFDLLELRKKVESRRIYLATDDPGLLSEARQKYVSRFYMAKTLLEALILAGIEFKDFNSGFCWSISVCHIKMYWILKKNMGFPFKIWNSW